MKPSLDTIFKHMSMYTLFECYFHCLSYPKIYHTISQVAAKSRRVNKHVFWLIFLTDLRVFLRYRQRFKYTVTTMDLFEVAVSWFVLLRLDKKRRVQSALHCFGALVLMLNGATKGPGIVVVPCTIAYLTLMYKVKSSLVSRHLSLLSEVFILSACIWVR